MAVCGGYIGLFPAMGSTAADTNFAGFLGGSAVVLKLWVGSDGQPGA